MSHLIDAATQLQIQQVLAFKNASSLMVNMARQVFGMAEAVEAPAVLKDGFAPIYEIVGTPRDYAVYVSDSMRAWTEVTHDLTSEIADLIASNRAA